MDISIFKCAKSGFGVSRREVLQKKEYLSTPYQGEASLLQCEPHEMETYLFVRSVLEEELDKILDRIFSGPFNQWKFREDEHRSEFVAKRREITNLAQMQLLAEQLLLEVTGELSRYIVHETVHICKLVYSISEDFVCESLLYDGNNANRRGDLCKRALEDLRSDRETSKPAIWRHDTAMSNLKQPEAQAVSTARGQAKKAAPSVQQVEDVTVVRHEFVPSHLKDLDILPYDHIPVRIYKYRLGQFRAAEVAYWKQYAVTSGDLLMPTEAGGVSCVQYSPNGQLLAIGSTNGDVIVAYPWSNPMRPLRGSGSRASGNTTRSLAWSQDSSILLSLHAGYLALWSVTRVFKPLDRAVNTDVNSTIRNIRDQNTIAAQQLRNILVLSIASADFKFVDGPFADDPLQMRLSEQWSPVRGCFVPMYELLGGQHRFAMAMSNNDVLWLSTTEVVRRALTDARAMAQRPAKADYLFPSQNAPRSHTISATHRIPCELLRRHKQEVVLMTFIDSCSEMLTVDSDGYMFFWKIGDENVSANRNTRVNNSFSQLPCRRYRIATTKTAFYTIPNATKTAKYEDSEYLLAVQQKRGGLSSNSRIRLAKRPLMEAERDRALLEFCRMRFTGPYVAQTEANIRTRYYHDPTEVQSNQEQSLLHILLDDVAPAQIRLVQEQMPVRSNAAGQPIPATLFGIGPLVIAYYTQPFRPATLQAVVVAVAVNPARSTLVLVLLYPAAELKGAHLDAVCVNLHTMKAYEPLIECAVTSNDERQIRSLLQKGSLSESGVTVAISRAIASLGTDYLLLQVLGNLSVYSLLGGSVVMCSAGVSVSSTIADVHFGDLRSSSFAVQSEASERFDRLQLLLHKRGVTYVRNINLEDRNLPADRLAISRLSSQLRFATQQDGKPNEPLFSELASNPYKCASRNEFDHRLADMRMLVYELMDHAIQSVSGMYPSIMQTLYAEQNAEEAYEYASRVLRPSVKSNANYN